MGDMSNHIGSFLFRAVGSPGSIFVPFLFVSDKNWGAGQNTLLGERSRASESVVESVRFILGSGSQESAFFVSGVRLWYCWTRKSLKKKNLKGRQNDDDTFSWEKKIFPAIFPLSDFFTPISPANVVSYGLRSVEQKKLKKIIQKEVSFEMAKKIIFRRHFAALRIFWHFFQRFSCSA